MLPTIYRTKSINLITHPLPTIFPCIFWLLLMTLPILPVFVELDVVVLQLTLFMDHILFYARKMFSVSYLQDLLSGGRLSAKVQDPVFIYTDTFFYACINKYMYLLLLRGVRRMQSCQIPKFSFSNPSTLYRYVHIT